MIFSDVTKTKDSRQKIQDGGLLASYDVIIDLYAAERNEAGKSTSVYLRNLPFLFLLMR